MNRLLTFFAVLGLVAAGTSVANAVVVIGPATNNGNLDATSLELPSPPGQVLATPTGWHVTASRAISGVFTDGASSEGFANVAAAGGQGLFFKPFTGDQGVPPPATPNGPVTANLFQDNPGTPGMKYILTGWAGAGAGYVGLIPTNTTTRSELAIDFLNAANAVIGGSTLDLKPGLIANQGNGNPFGYSQYMTMAVAPAGTATVRARASMINAFGNPLGGDQAFVVDVFTLDCIPEPATAMLVVFGLLGVVGLIRRR